MSRYCKKQGQVLSDTHWCETCPQEIGLSPIKNNSLSPKKAKEGITPEEMQKFIDAISWGYQ
jgi:hypothetical protein